VVKQSNEVSLRCACNKFIRDGIMCRHMLKILINDDAGYIPDKFILRHWTGALVPVELQAARARYGEVDSEKDAIINSLYNQLDIIVNRSRDDKAKLLRCGDELKHLMEKVGGNELAMSSAKEKADAFRDCYGVDQPEDDDVLAPSGVRNKGCGKGKRLVGALEKATTKSQRAKRLCRCCGENVNHDSSNCPLRK